MTLQRTHSREGAVIAVAGALTIGRPVEALRRAVFELLARGCRRVKIDVRQVPYADASGVGALVECRKRARAAGALLIMEGTRGKLRELLDLLGLGMDFAPAPALAPIPRRLGRHGRDIAGATLKCRVA